MSLEENEISKGSGSTPGYTVEARCNSKILGPKVLKNVGRNGQGLILHSEWVQVPHEAVPTGFGVPNGSRFSDLDRHGLLSWPAANAIRWWFIAALDHDSTSVETRIVEHVLETTHKITKKGEHDVMDHTFWKRKGHEGI